MEKKKKFPTGSVCKPCWELKYCPYGHLVEYFPFAGDQRTHSEIKSCYDEALNRLLSGDRESEQSLWHKIDDLHINRPANWEYIQEYEADEVNCKIFGHACPVFFAQSGGTETKESRLDGRHIPRQIMLQVVRRDNHVCQACYKYVPDDEIEFDHIIPVSRGGPTSVTNLRLLCRTCNRQKSNTMDGFLIT